MTVNNYDLAIVGGGVSGVCAGVTAARKGLRAVLVEQRDVLGGTVIAGFHRFICGLYANDRSNPFSLLNSGISREMVDRLDALSPGDNKTRMGRVELYSFDREHLKNVLMDLAGSEGLLDVMLCTTLVSVGLCGNRIDRLTVRHDRGEDIFEPSAVIDCSGNGVVVRLSGAGDGHTADRERQLSGYSIRIDDIRGDDDILAVKVPYFVRRAVDNGILPDDLRFTTFSPGMLPSSGTCRLSIWREPEKDCDEKARAYGLQVHALLKEKIEAFRHSVIKDRSPCVLDRDGGMFPGEYVLTEEDVLTARKFPDGMVKCGWPIEFWHRSKGPEYLYLEEGECYEIPQRCLRSKAVENLFSAGRCISATPRALASSRVVGTCMALGEAAAMVVHETHESLTKHISSLGG